MIFQDENTEQSEVAESPQDAIGSYKRFLWPTLKAVGELGEEEATNDQIYARVITLMGLPDDALAVLHKDGPKTEVSHRIGWSRTKLKGVGVIDNPRRGAWNITEKGRAVSDEEELQLMVSTEDNRRAALRRHQKSAALQAAAQQRYSTQTELPAQLPALPRSLGGQQSRGRKVRLTRTIRQTDSWQEQVLANVRQLSPDQFVRLCHRLLSESGFTAVEIEQTAEGNYSGYGLLRINVLVFSVMFRIYRAQVGVEAVHNLRGAMIGRAEQGILLTTGSVDDAARTEASREGAPPVELIDDQKLCDLMRAKNLGVRTVEIGEVQTSYFTELVTSGA